MRARSAVVYQTLVSVFWLTRGGTAGLASSRYEGVVDTFVTVFPDEVIRAQETWARRAFPNLIHFHEADRGGHFAMWEKGGRVFRGFLWNIKCNGALVDNLVVRVNQFNQHFVRTGRQGPQDERVATRVRPVPRRLVDGS
jgi:hypothetical protein